MDKLQTYLDRLSIVVKFPDNKWDMERRHYIVKIGDDTFDYRGSAKDYEDYIRCIDYAIHNVGKYCTMKRRDWTIEELVGIGSKKMNIKLKTDDEHKRDILRALVSDYQSYEGCKDEREFIDEYGYEPREGHRVRGELERNYEKMKRLFTVKEMEELFDLYSDY